MEGDKLREVALLVVFFEKQLARARLLILETTVLLVVFLGGVVGIMVVSWGPWGSLVFGLFSVICAMCIVGAGAAFVWEQSRWMGKLFDVKQEVLSRWYDSERTERR